MSCRARIRSNTCRRTACTGLRRCAKTAIRAESRPTGTRLARSCGWSARCRQRKPAAREPCGRDHVETNGSCSVGPAHGQHERTGSHLPEVIGAARTQAASIYKNVEVPVAAAREFELERPRRGRPAVDEGVALTRKQNARSGGDAFGLAHEPRVVFVSQRRRSEFRVPGEIAAVEPLPNDGPASGGGPRAALRADRTA